MYYTYGDYLGSILAITDSVGNLIAEQSFDPWGRKRNVDNWTYDNIADFTLLDRGYTGHQHLYEFGIINMNGRLYDPVLGRMLSPDPYIQLPGFAQNYNRYSYVWNNPLRFTDPSGEFVFSVLAAIFAPPLLPVAIGADLGWIGGGIKAKKQGETFWYGAWRGGVAGAIGGGLSMFGGGTFVANLAWGAGQGMLMGGLNAALWGEDIGKGILYGALSGMAFASVTSGIEAIKNYKDYGMFRTDIGAFNKMVDNVQNAYLSNDYTQLMADMSLLNRLSYDKFGIHEMTFSGYRSVTVPSGKASVAFFDNDGANGMIKRSGAAIRRSMSHENGHLNNIIQRISFKNDKIQISKSFYTGDNLTILGQNHGTVGYYDAIRQAGKLHLGTKIIENTRPGTQIAWEQFGYKKWFYLIPKRF